MISIEEFQKIWQESSGPRDVARKTGMKVETVYARAVRYRKRGIELKRFRLPVELQIAQITGYEVLSDD